MQLQWKCSSSLCSCRTRGLYCVAACGKCHGNDCINIRSDADDAVDSDSDDGMVEDIVDMSELKRKCEQNHYFIEQTRNDQTPMTLIIVKLMTRIVKINSVKDWYYHTGTAIGILDFPHCWPQ